MSEQPNIPFEVGALVTGVNRTHQRSIYRYVGIVPVPKGKGLEGGLSVDTPLVGALGVHLQFVAFKGQEIRDKEIWDVYRLPDTVVANYRLATAEEVKDAQGD